MKEEMMGKYLISHNALIEIGARLKAYRIDYPMSQKDLADKSGVAIRSISRMENGEDVQFSNLIKVLIALDLDANLDMLVPDPTKRPSYYLRDSSLMSQRKRVSKKKSEYSSRNINWGDEKNE
jgi:transcriptional regulator with XRE-family HTH domain